MRLLVSVLILAAASAVLAQNQAGLQSSESQANVIAPPGGSISLQVLGGLPNSALTVNRSPQTLKEPGEQKSLCFTMRSYRFTRDDPKSEATNMTGYSTCQASKDLQLKGAAGLVKTGPRNR